MKFKRKILSQQKNAFLSKDVFFVVLVLVKLFCDVAIEVFKALDGYSIAICKAFGIEIVGSVAHGVIIVLKVVVESGDAC